MEEKKRYGAIYTESGTEFILPTKRVRGAVLRLWKTGSDEEEDAGFLGSYPMQKSRDGVFSARIDGDLAGIYYDYLLDYSWGRQAACADPWARACGVNGYRSMVVDLARTNPEGWKEDRRISGNGAAPVIWETHVSDFSFDASSGAQHRGKYLGFAESVGLEHCRKLGITHIQLQPIADFCTVDERFGNGYNWGYDIGNYNVPEGSYASDAFHGEVRIREVKTMIQAIHRAGLGVILDVVYNHTYSKKSWLSLSAPGVYYRTNGHGRYCNASGCGNETASERAPFRQYMLESVRYWAEEYHVDGFRFDLMAIHDVQTMNLIRESLNSLPGGREILMLGEPWAASKVNLEPPDRPADVSSLTLLSDGISAFSGETKTLLCGNCFDLRARGWASGAPDTIRKQDLVRMLEGWCGEGMARSPAQTVHYVSCHDNYALWDRLSAACTGKNGKPAPERAGRFNQLCAAMVMLSSGIAFFQSGEEFCRTKHGNGNSYRGPAELNSLKWSDAGKNAELSAWYRGLIRIRRNVIPSLDSMEYGTVHLLDSPAETLVFEKACRTDGRWASILVLCNPYPQDYHYVLPDGNWQVLCDGKSSECWLSGVMLVRNAVTMKAESVIILARE